MFHTYKYVKNLKLNVNLTQDTVFLLKKQVFTQLFF